MTLIFDAIFQMIFKIYQIFFLIQKCKMRNNCANVPYTQIFCW